MSYKRGMPVYNGYFTISLFFDAAIRKSLVDVAKFCVQKPAIATRGVHAPHSVLLHAESKMSIPVNLFEVFFEEFDSIRKEPMSIVQVTLDADEHVFMVGDAGPRLILFQKLLHEHFEKCATIHMDDQWYPYIYIGKGIKDEKRLRSIEMFLDVHPVKIAVGNLDDAWGFKTIVDAESYRELVQARL